MSALVSPPPSSSSATSPLSPLLSPAASCPNCGAGLFHPHHEVAEHAQRRIEELEAQVRILTGKASAAVDKLADYEDQLRQLKSAQPATESRSQNLTSADPPRPATANVPPATQSVHNRLSSFLISRKSTSNLPHIPPTKPNEPSTSDLQAALMREQTLRQQAEGKLSQANGELEELSSQLFMQANEMVATERKARAKLEERVEVLERRDGEKRKRLDRLEGALKRIERPLGLAPPPSLVPRSTTGHASLQVGSAPTEEHRAIHPQMQREMVLGSQADAELTLLTPEVDRGLIRASILPLRPITLLPRSKPSQPEPRFLRVWLRLDWVIGHEVAK
ncbi:MAG: hypothetical protein M1819_005090 [Sarea resinae]|nr:MAG: hypothetical protein M1819_005090 [Sarea resinae]